MQPHRNGHLDTLKQSSQLLGVGQAEDLASMRNLSLDGSSDSQILRGLKGNQQQIGLSGLLEARQRPNQAFQAGSCELRMGTQRHCH